MVERSIRAWHFTRLADHEVAAVRAKGLQPMTLALIAERLEADQQAGLIDAQFSVQLYELIGLQNAGFVHPGSLSFVIKELSGEGDVKSRFLLELEEGFRIEWEWPNRTVLGPSIPVYLFTGMGVQIGSILPAPDLEANLRRVALAAPDRERIVSVTLKVGGQWQDILGDVRGT
jgi:hypothetical protein